MDTGIVIVHHSLVFLLCICVGVCMLYKLLDVFISIGITFQLIFHFSSVFWCILSVSCYYNYYLQCLLLSSAEHKPFYLEVEITKQQEHLVLVFVPAKVNFTLCTLDSSLTFGVLELAPLPPTVNRWPVTPSVSTDFLCGNGLGCFSSSQTLSPSLVKAAPSSWLRDVCLGCRVCTIDG